MCVYVCVCVCVCVRAYIIYYVYIHTHIRGSIEGLADMVQELGGMLANWSPNVTVQTVPVKVSVCRVAVPANVFILRCVEYAHEHIGSEHMSILVAST